MSKWLDSDGNLNEDMFVEGSFPKDYQGPVYVTPDWVRHPEKYPELMKRLEVWAEKFREEQEKSE